MIKLHRFRSYTILPVNPVLNNEMKVKGAVAIITGGARGLGRAFAEALLKQGAKVCLADVNVEEGRQTEKSLQSTYGDDFAMFVKCDVTKDEEFKGLLEAAVKKFNTVSIMVNNAGMLNEEYPFKTVEVNLMGVMKGTNLAVEHMRKDKGGKGGLILNIASHGGLFPAFFMPAYCASKYGIVGFTRSWAGNPMVKEKYGVSFAVLCPAFTDTLMLENTDGRLFTYEENKESVDGLIKAVGINSVEDVVEAFMDIVEKEDNNGAVVTVDQRNKIAYRYKDHPHKL